MSKASIFRAVLVLMVIFSFGYANAQKIYIVNYESQADVKVYVVGYESQAGWKNQARQYLMF